MDYTMYIINSMNADTHTATTRETEMEATVATATAAVEAAEAAEAAVHSAEGWHFWALDPNSRTAAAEAASQARLEAARADLEAATADLSEAKVAQAVPYLAAMHYQAHATL